MDIAGSGPVHLIGGASAFASAAMLGPRLGRYSHGNDPLPLGNPVNACMGMNSNEQVKNESINDTHVIPFKAFLFFGGVGLLSILAQHMEYQDQSNDFS